MPEARGVLGRWRRHFAPGRLARARRPPLTGARSSWASSLPRRRPITTRWMSSSPLAHADRPQVQAVDRHLAERLDGDPGRDDHRLAAEVERRVDDAVDAGPPAERADEP